MKDSVGGISLYITFFGVSNHGFFDPFSDVYMADIHHKLYFFLTGLWSCTTCATSLVVCQADGIDSHGSELCGLERKLRLK